MLKLLEIPIFIGLNIEVYFILICISVPTFFFWSWFFRKYITEKPKQTIATWISTIILTPIIYIGLIAIFIYFISSEHSRNFDKPKWLTDREGRFEMGDDIFLSVGVPTNRNHYSLKQLNKSNSTPNPI